MIDIIEEKLESGEITSMELAAAFLKLGMGEELKDIKIEKFVPRKSGSRDRRGVDRRTGGRNDRDRAGNRSRFVKGEKKGYGSYGDKKNRNFDKKDVQTTKTYHGRRKSGELKGNKRREKKAE